MACRVRIKRDVDAKETNPDSIKFYEDTHRFTIGLCPVWVLAGPARASYYATVGRCLCRTWSRIPFSSALPALYLPLRNSIHLLSRVSAQPP